MAATAEDNWAFYLNDASHTSSTIIGSATTAVTLIPDTKFQFRQSILIADANTDKEHSLFYSLNGGAMTVVQGAGVGSVVIVVQTASYANWSDTTQRISSGAYVTDNNWAVQHVNNSISGKMPSNNDNERCEAVWTFQIVGADVSDGDDIELTTADGIYTTGGTGDIVVYKPTRNRVNVT